MIQEIPLIIIDVFLIIIVMHVILTIRLYGYHAGLRGNEFGFMILFSELQQSDWS